MTEVDRNQLRITLVHGTWGRGLSPSSKASDRPLFWFESYSRFWIRLSIGLYGIPHEIKPLIWSGSNSIFARDETAYALAQTLFNEHLENPRATQIVIAHSHGGNIALRAFEYLNKLRTSQASTVADPSPLIVTLAAPFVEVHPADFGRRPFLVRLALVLSTILILTFLLLHLNKFVFDVLLDSPSATIAFASWASCVVAPSFFGAVAGWWWIRRRTRCKNEEG